MWPGPALRETALNDQVNEQDPKKSASAFVIKAHGGEKFRSKISVTNLNAELMIELI